VQRYGKRQLINEFGMRSPALSTVEAGRRYLVLGDSVLNGGTGVDHGELATTQLSDDNRFFGNASANSWGPANQAAWIRQFGDTGASAAIVLISSHDATDLPSFGPLNPREQPTEGPLLALQEVWPHLAPKLGISIRAVPTNAPPADPSRSAAGQKALDDLITALETKGLPVCAIQHQTRTEIRSKPEAGWHTIRQAFTERGWPVVQMARWTAPALAKDPEIFTDDIHLAPAGQALIAEAIKACAAELEGQVD
jgi:hypothetical protein